MTSLRGFAVALLVISVALAGCAGGSAGEAEAPTASATDETGAIEGRIVTDEWLPIAGAEVTLLPPDQTVRTDQGGAFAFNDVEPGSYRLIAVKIGYYQNTAQVDVEAGNVYEVDLPLDAVPVAPPPKTVVTEFHGNVTVGTVAGDSEPVVGNDVDSQDFTLTIPSKDDDGVLLAASSTVIALTPADTPQNEANDLDLYLLGPDGQTLGSSTSSTATELIEENDWLPAGDYTIRVYFWSGAVSEYTLTVTITYEQGEAAAFLIKKESG